MSPLDLEEISPDITEQIEWIKANLRAAGKIMEAEMKVIQRELQRREYNKLFDTHDTV